MCGIKKGDLDGRPFLHVIASIATAKKESLFKSPALAGGVREEQERLAATLYC